MTRVRLVAFPFRKFPLPDLLLMPKNPRVTFQGLFWIIGALKKQNKTALLRYNSHATQLTHLKYTVERLYKMFPRWHSHHHNLILEHFLLLLIFVLKNYFFLLWTCSFDFITSTISGVCFLFEFISQFLDRILYSTG